MIFLYDQLFAIVFWLANFERAILADYTNWKIFNTKTQRLTEKSLLQKNEKGG